MKKTYNENELKEKAAKVFAQFPTATEVYATSDGNIFIEKNRAELHIGFKGKVLPIQKPEAKAETSADTEEPALLNVNKTSELVAAANTLEELKAFEGDERKTVINAVAKRKAELEAEDVEPGAGKDEEEKNPQTAGTDQKTESKGLGKDGKSPEDRNENSNK